MNLQQQAKLILDILDGGTANKIDANKGKIQDFAYEAAKVLPELVEALKGKVYLPDFGEIPLRSALENMTDEFMDDGNCCAETTMNLRDILKAVIAALAKLTPETQTQP